MKDFEKYLKDPIFMQMVKKYSEESERFNKNKSKIDKEHDKIIKRVFEKKKEAARFISKVIGIEIEGEELISAKNSFVTTELKYREADIVYKIKGMNVVILIEHQTRVDYRMSYRILNYQVEIMRANEIENPKKEDKEMFSNPNSIIYRKRKVDSKKIYKRNTGRIFRKRKNRKKTRIRDIRIL